MDKEITEILEKNAERNTRIYALFNPITGEGSIGSRVRLEISDFSVPVQYVPVRMMEVPLIKKLASLGSVRAFIENEYAGEMEYNEASRNMVAETFIRIRCRHDFPFWAAFFVYIKKKGGGEDVLFRLTPPQRRIAAYFEKCRLAGKPIRLLILKARQLGGSTTIQIYMAWLQLVHRTGLNSLIISLQGKSSDEIFDMYDRMIKAYPVAMLHELGEKYKENEPKWVGVGSSGAIHRVPQRNCKIKLGSAEKPDSCRGGDYSLVHLSEVGLWKKTEGKAPEDIVQSACSGILLKSYTMIVYESTARGTGNFFHKEYIAAKNGDSQFCAMFIRWFEIPQWSLPFENERKKILFAN